MNYIKITSIRKIHRNYPNATPISEEYYNDCIMAVSEDKTKILYGVPMMVNKRTSHQHLTNDEDAEMCEGNTYGDLYNCYEDYVKREIEEELKYFYDPNPPIFCWDKDFIENDFCKIPEGEIFILPETEK